MELKVEVFYLGTLLDYTIYTNFLFFVLKINFLILMR